MGNISGVNPTATASANSEASTQSPLLKPLISRTTGTMISIKRINSQLTLLTPRSKAVWVRVPTMDFASEPNGTASRRNHDRLRSAAGYIGSHQTDIAQI